MFCKIFLIIILFFSFLIFFCISSNIYIQPKIPDPNFQGKGQLKELHDRISEFISQKFSEKINQFPNLTLQDNDGNNEEEIINFLKINRKQENENTSELNIINKNEWEQLLKEEPIIADCFFKINIVEQINIIYSEIHWLLESRRLILIASSDEYNKLRDVTFRLNELQLDIKHLNYLEKLYNKIEKEKEEKNNKKIKKEFNEKEIKGKMIVEEYNKESKNNFNKIIEKGPFIPNQLHLNLISDLFNFRKEINEFTIKTKIEIGEKSNIYQIIDKIMINNSLNNQINPPFNEINKELKIIKETKINVKKYIQEYKEIRDFDLLNNMSKILYKKINDTFQSENNKVFDINIGIIWFLSKKLIEEQLGNIFYKNSTLRSLIQIKLGIKEGEHNKMISAIKEWNELPEQLISGKYKIIDETSLKIRIIINSINLLFIFKRINRENNNITKDYGPILKEIENNNYNEQNEEEIKIKKEIEKISMPIKIEELIFEFYKSWKENQTNNNNNQQNDKRKILKNLKKKKKPKSGLTFAEWKEMFLDGPKREAKQKRKISDQNNKIKSIKLNNEKNNYSKNKQKQLNNQNIKRKRQKHSKLNNNETEIIDNNNNNNNNENNNKHGEIEEEISIEEEEEEEEEENKLQLRRKRINNNNIAITINNPKQNIQQFKFPPQEVVIREEIEKFKQRNLSIHVIFQFLFISKEIIIIL
ncbi:hypothetical protein Mgra_00002321 [Meloidogyne graminicola]|uniref:Uncharacterized protein n=1 Tax=Meloidogyne graminicola TaxID=189291 RepID=A0A8S9ZYZ3_9BILA|nr:hypothetical protein Mgra_00002321 [Meloidogyne graminicola]